MFGLLDGEVEDENQGDEAWMPDYVLSDTLKEIYGYLRYSDDYQVTEAIELHGGWM